MDVFNSINWIVVFGILAVFFISWNVYAIIRSSIIKKQAEEEVKKIDAKIAGVNQEIAAVKKELADQIKRLSR
ncbi:MAG: hypothetical protein ABIH50_06695 [bacterium]